MHPKAITLQPCHCISLLAHIFLTLFCFIFFPSFLEAARLISLTQLSVSLAQLACQGAHTRMPWALSFLCNFAKMSLEVSPLYLLAVFFFSVAGVLWVEPGWWWWVQRKRTVFVSKGHNCLAYSLLLNYVRRWKAVPRSAPAKEVTLCQTDPALFWRWLVFILL